MTGSMMTPYNKIPSIFQIQLIVYRLEVPKLLFAKIKRHRLVAQKLKKLHSDVLHQISTKSLSKFEYSTKCASEKNENLSSVTDKCGDLTKFGITIGEGVNPNCKGLACFPQCDDPNKMPNFQKLACIKKKGKNSIVPSGFNLQCVGQ